MEEEDEYEEDEDDVSQNKAVVNNENKEPTPEKIVEQKSEDKKDTHSKKSKGKSYKASKSNDNAYKLPKPEHVESTRSFLESTVTTAIQEALLELARKRDEIQDPLTFVGEYLIKKAKEKNQ